jgi:plastocyanin
MADNVGKNPAGGDVDWSRRQFLVGTGGLAVVGVAALFGRSAIGQAAQAMMGPPPVSKGLVHVYTGDYYYIPKKMTWQVGDKISLLFHNQSPNRFHEMMIGRGFDTTPSIFGDVKTQFHTDFWDGVHVTVAKAQGVDNLATNKAIATSEVNPHPWLITAPGNGNFSPTLMPGGMIQFDFTVPNKPGKWQYACFVQGFVHYRAGMRGDLTILPKA